MRLFIFMFMSMFVISSKLGYAEYSSFENSAYLEPQKLAEACLDRKPKKAIFKGFFKQDESIKDTCPIKHFFKAAENIYRGQRPQAPIDFEILRILGVKLIINIEDYTSSNKEEILRETFEAEKRGIRLIHRPLSPIFLHKKSDVGAILQFMANADQEPVYLHCRYGKERTGFLVALHLIFNLHKKIPEAKRDMLKHGFRSFLVPAMYFQFKYWMADFGENGVFPYSPPN